MNSTRATRASNALFPSLHHRKEGWLHHQENVAKPPKPMQTGWFSFGLSRKTTPSSRSEEASRYLFDRSATPPCGDARRGMATFRLASERPERLVQAARPPHTYFFSSNCSFWRVVSGTFLMSVMMAC